MVMMTFIITSKMVGRSYSLNTISVRALIVRMMRVMMIYVLTRMSRLLKSSSSILFRTLKVHIVLNCVSFSIMFINF